MNPVTVVIGFLPLVLFSLLDGRLPVAAAATVGALAAVVVFAVGLRRAVAALPVVQAVTLAAIAAIGFLSSNATQHVLTDYGRGIASLVVAGFILVTVGFAPFTLAFARSAVPRDRWHSPQFLSLNRRISVAWGLAIAVIGVFRLISAAVSSQLSYRSSLLLDWAPTIVLIIVALRYTQRTVAEANGTAAAQPQPPTIG